ncbi:hypothetical protein Haur_5086 (plasmid) [Herpetosiphon aurantiacus DSM 785]|uniref:Uncharacterized protein n=1 Tax=Herpetosiphon aurantiacus (strain ATCC 23779 / DSM 785 / 114-95) TaxID=316274 RepID=A9B8Q0_HERA2|nr:hypothetical protein Haur_5086 [Herpetosiphon aurantiacus DSM 785]
MNEQGIDQVHDWLRVNDPAYYQAYHASETITGFRQRLQLAEDPVTSVVSNARLVGNNADAVLNDSRALQAAISTATQAQGLSQFKKNPMDGCTSVMNIARIAANFNPITPNITGNYQAYNTYIEKILSAPFFNLNFTDIKVVNQSSSNWNEAIDSFVNLFEGILDSDRSKIKEGLVALTKAATSHLNQKQEQQLFVQNVLQADTNAYTIAIYYSQVELVEDSKKGGTTKQSTFKVARTLLSFRVNEWPYFAEAVWGKHVQTVIDWLNVNTTTAGARTVNLCLE